MRIAFHVPRALYLEPGFSGDMVLVRSLLAGLEKQGHQVKIVSRVDAKHVWRGRIPARRLFQEAILIRTAMQRFSPDAWLVYGASTEYPDLFGWWQHPKRYALFAAAAGRPERLPRPWRWLFAFAHRRSLSRADKIAVFRPKSVKHLRAAGVAEERLCVLPPAVKMWDWMPSQEEARRRLGLPQDVAVILCVSRFSLGRAGRPGKTDMILDLLAVVAPLPPDVRIVVVGDGPGRQRVEDEVAKRKLEGRVWLTGSVDDVRWFYAACDLFAYPYWLDRIWVAVLEAQASGRPVVTMRTDSAPVSVEAGRTGLLAKDLEEFQAHLAALASDRTRCQAMGQAAREYIARCHTIEIRVRQIKELLLGLGS